MDSDKVTVALIQISASKDADLNLQKTVGKIQQAAINGAKIICLPELFKTRYFPQWEKRDASNLAEAIPGQSTDTLSKIAKKLEIVIITPIFEKDEGGHFYNSVVVIDADGSLLKTYRKTHIPHDPFFYEKDYFSPGDEICIYETRYAKFAVLICYDQWFPEMARAAALQGADIIFYPTAIGWIEADKTPEEGDWRDAWQTIQRAHAISNSVYVATVNRVGLEDGIRFWGSSFVCNSFGKVLAVGSENSEDLLIVDLDLTQNELIRESWGFFKNRRPDIYWPLIEMVRLARKKSDNQKKPKIQRTNISFSTMDMPRSLGYHMPAEWEKHEAVWLSWPYDIDTFPRIKMVENTYLSIIRALHERETVNLLVKDEPMLDMVVDLLRKSEVDLRKIKFHIVVYADVWFRDYGPTFVVNREKYPVTDSRRIAMVSWIFNAWGEKYEDLKIDSRIPCFMNDDLMLECFKPGIVMEGGSIDVNGWGTVLTTEQCLLNKNRNPSLSKDEIEFYIKEYLSVSKVIWLKEGIAGDDTDGHVDDIARFINPSTVLCAYEEDPEDENYQILKDNYEILCHETDQDGNPLKVIKLPMPGRVGREHRLPASYANFYIGNDVVLVPVFGHKNDKEAIKIIQESFPERRVIGINCIDMVEGLGTIHCVSLQQPAK